MEVEKVKRRKEKELSTWEGQAWLTREVLAAILNSAGKSYKHNFDPKKLIPLSFDSLPKQEVERKPMTDKEMKQKFGSKFNKNG